MKLTKADARRALVAHHFAPTTLQGAFERLRSVQFDPLSPAGCNHDLVLQSRVPGYKVGDWTRFAYKERAVFDGWDKQACLIPVDGWNLRRFFHDLLRPGYTRILENYPHAVEAVLAELREKGPMLPREFEFQEHKPEWKGSWYGPNLTKQTLRALWNTGQVMTHDRRGQHHVYDLTERVLPESVHTQAKLTFDEGVHGLVRERHRAVGLLRPTAPFEVWGFNKVTDIKRQAYAEFEKAGELVPVDVDGMSFYADPAFLQSVGASVPDEVRFVAPLDQLMWDRKAIAHVFEFDYVWEVYVPEPKRKWGYYVLPVLFGDRLVARVDPWCRNGVLEFRAWHWEDGHPSPEFWPAFEQGLARFMAYCGAKKLVCAKHVDKRVRDAGRVAAKSA